MADRISRKTIKQDEFIDAAFDAGAWIEKHWRTAVAVVAAAAALLLVVAAWNWWSARRTTEVSNLLAEGLRLYVGAPESGPGPAAPRYADALPILEEASRKGGNSAPGRVASFYRGATLLRLGRAAEAIPVLDGVASSAPERTLADGARALLAEAQAKAGDLEKARATYRSLADTPGAAFPPDVALLQLARLYEERGRTREARETLQEIVTKYPQGGVSGEARARLQGGASGQSGPR
jgi:tetratricopeptide (TPR) repeat protein